VKKLIFILIVIAASTSVLFASEYQSPMSIYKDNYFIAGDKDDQVKVQLSMKFNLFYPSSTGFYAGYTQLSNWLCYEDRDTFYTMYCPEVFYRFESGNNLFGDSTLPFVDFLQVSPIVHNSTGVEGENHRSVNMYYAQAQLSYGEVYNVGVGGKYFRYYSISDKNEDINKYRKNYEADIFFKLKSKTVEYLDKEELHFKFGGNPLGNGWYCIEAQFRIISSKFQPKIFLQFYKGRDEIMVNYDKKTESVRIGLIF